MQTILSKVVSSSIVLLAVYFIGPAMAYLPKLVLASIIVVAIIQIVEVQALPKFWRVQRRYDSEGSRLLRMRAGPGASCSISSSCRACTVLT